MSELVVIGYKSKFAAEEVRLQLLKMQREDLRDLDDAVVVVKEPSGHLKLQHVHSPTTSGAPGDSFWELLVGALFFSPWLGAAPRAATGTLCGVLAEVGIDDACMKALADTLQPGSSALFVFVRQARPEREVEELKSTGGKLLKISLRHEAPEPLQAALDAITIPPPPGSATTAEKKPGGGVSSKLTQRPWNSSPGCRGRTPAGSVRSVPG